LWAYSSYTVELFKSLITAQCRKPASLQKKCASIAFHLCTTSDSSCNADPFDSPRSATNPQMPRFNSRCDGVQYYPAPAPQLSDAAPYQHTSLSRGGVPAPRTEPPMFHSQTASQPTQPNVQQQIQRHQQVLIYLRHCAKCTDPTRCVYSSICQSGKQLWNHIFQCSNPRCTYLNCVFSRELLRHYQKCVNTKCPICGPVRSFVASDVGTPNTSALPF
jgi:hypothetical protein